MCKYLDFTVADDSRSSRQFDITPQRKFVVSGILLYQILFNQVSCVSHFALIVQNS